MRKKKNLPVLKNIGITGIAAEGKALARYEGMVLFVPFLAPGDIADIQVTKKRRNYLEGRALTIHTESGMRSEPFCEHFGTCGGCKWQHLDYRYQLGFKQQQVTDQFTRIGKVDLPSPDPIMASAETTYYRNKLEFTFTSRRWITEKEIASGSEVREFRAAGFHIPGRFDKVMDINTCYLQHEPSNAIRLAVKEYAIGQGLDFFDLVQQKGFLRTLIIRTAVTGEVMVILVFFQEERVAREKLLEHLAGKFPGITSLMYVINPKSNDTIADLDVTLFRGRDHILEEMEGLRFKVGPKSFYQTNSLQAHELYKVVLEYAAPAEDDIVYDLYTGTGTIAAFIAGRCREVIGLEYLEEAVDDARYNAVLNNLDNVRFFAGDIRELLTPGFVGQHGSPGIVITDPPRTGMHHDVVSALLEISPPGIVYVSCNPATQARDINLMDNRYRVERMRAVDMFPHTHHIENVALLVRRQD